jgi:membrane fusion protein (multidrug efflux system)
MSSKKKDLKIYIPLTAVILLIIVASIYWYIDYSSYVKTDDAYVTSDVVTVSPKIMGRIAKLYVEEGDSVKEGQLVAEIDSTDLLAQKAQVVSTKAQTQAAKTQAEAKYEYDVKNINVLKVGIDKAKEDYDRTKTQYNGGVTTKEQYDHAKKALEAAQAQYDAAKSLVNVSKTQIAASETSIKSSEAQIQVINTQLKNTRLYAASNGLIAKRWLLQGDVVNVGQSIFTINNNSKFWVNVFLEETKLQGLHIGQAAKFTLDTYPDVIFTGKIFLIGSTTASQFSLIP